MLRNPRQGDLVISRAQTAGIGRENRVWYSQEGGLWLTLILIPPLPEILSDIPSIATETVVATLGQFGIQDCKIKLPNDVYCRGKKIAGVLADASVKGTHSIVYLGIGINLNNDPSSIAELSQTATSVKLITNRTVDVVQFAASFIVNLDSLYDSKIKILSCL